jgi:hypothetical protein
MTRMASHLLGPLRRLAAVLPLAAVAALSHGTAAAQAAQPGDAVTASAPTPATSATPPALPAPAAAVPAAVGTTAAVPPPLPGGAQRARQKVATASRAHVQVLEDDGVRIEESRVRGQLTRVTVQSKLQGARAYDVLVPAPGQDPSKDRGVAGASAWRLLSF